MKSWVWLLPAVLLEIKTSFALPGQSYSHSYSSSATASGGTSATSLPFPITPKSSQGDDHYVAPNFPLLGWQKYAGNPIITPDPSHNWESAYTYNPTAIVIDETIFLLYRAQNASLTSSIGLGWSTDGIHFTRLANPIFYATEPYEHTGGTEDPRIIRVDGTFYLTYTGFNGTNPLLCLATSTDLLNWHKYGPIFPQFSHSKSAAIIDEKAADGLYHMYFNDSDIVQATSPNLIDWSLVPHEPFATPVDDWDADLIEPGPPLVKTQNGDWILIYNGKSNGSGGYIDNSYSTGQMLINPTDENGPLARLAKPFLIPSTPQELTGQTDDVIFSEGLVQFKGKWYLYYG